MTSIKRVLKIFTILMGISVCTLAHEFWIGLSNYRIGVNEVVQVQFYVGENFNGEIWAARKKRTAKVIEQSVKGKKDFTLEFINDTLPVKLAGLSAGIHIITMESNASYIEMKAKKFNEYLAEDGIDNIAFLRKQNDELEKDSRELYQRCAKTIFQVGSTTDSSYKIIAGMPLELVPQKNPYSLKVGDKLPVLLLFQDQPLINYKAGIWNRIKGNLSAYTLISDNKGTVDVPINHAGEWMISIVKMVENPDKTKADYKSYWGSLTFGL